MKMAGVKKKNGHEAMTSVDGGLRAAIRNCVDFAAGFAFVVNTLAGLTFLPNFTRDAGVQVVTAPSPVSAQRLLLYGASRIFAVSARRIPYGVDIVAGPFVVVAGNLRLPGPRFKSCSGITDVYIVFSLSLPTKIDFGCVCAGHVSANFKPSKVSRGGWEKISSYGGTSTRRGIAQAQVLLDWLVLLCLNSCFACSSVIYMQPPLYTTYREA